MNQAIPLALSLAASALLLAGAPAAALAQAAAAEAAALSIPAGRYVLDRKHASLLFSVRHLGLSDYTARFTRFDATVDLDPQNLAASRVEATIDPLSIETDYPGETDFDGELARQPEYLDGSKHPEIRFVSRQVQASGPDALEVTGDLTLKGVTRPVTLQVSIIGAKPHPFTKTPALGIAARGAFERSGFGMTSLLPDIVSDRVELRVNAEFRLDQR